jgi:hypothetical protein
MSQHHPPARHKLFVPPTNTMTLAQMPVTVVLPTALLAPLPFHAPYATRHITNHRSVGIPPHVLMLAQV